MNRHEFLEHIRRRILNDENKVNNRRSCGIEKAANKTRKFRITRGKARSPKKTFEENVLRKAQTIRTSAAFKECCRRLKDYSDDENNLYYSLPSLYSSKRDLRVEKNSFAKNMEYFHSKHFSNATCCSEGGVYDSSAISANEEPQMTKAVLGVNGFLRNSSINSHLLQSGSMHTRNKMNEIKEGGIVQAQITVAKPNDTFDWSKKKIVAQPMNFNIDSCRQNSPCDKIDVKIKQSFNTLNNLENDIDEAARFLQASFSNRLSISSQFKCSKINERYISEKHPNDNCPFPTQDTKGVTRGRVLGCQLKAQLAYGRNVAIMSQHIRDVRDTFSTQLLLDNHEVDDGITDSGDGMNSSSNERCFHPQSSFYATVQQRMNKAFQHNSLVNNMHKLRQHPLKERNYDPVDSPISSFSKSVLIEDNDFVDGDRDSDDVKNEVRNAKSEVTPQTVARSGMELTKGTSLTHSPVLNDTIRSDKVSGSSLYCSQELLKREYYARSTVRALRQFYSDSMLYFAELHKLYCQQRIEDLGKVEKEEEKIRAACLALKRKYIDSVRGAMSLKNLVDYHLHETARIQLLNLDLQKHLALLKGRKKDSNFEKFRQSSEKVLLFTKDFEKNNLANELERWELKLRTRLLGFKIDEDRTVNIDSSRRLFSSPVRVNRIIQEVKVQNSRCYNKNLQLLREELKLKRKEADFLKKAFDQRVMHNDQSEENSLKAQIDAHVRYIRETEKDIAQLNELHKEDDANNKKLSVVPASSYDNHSSLSSKFTPIKATVGKTFSEADKRTSFNANVHSTSNSCDSVWDPKKESVVNLQFPKLSSSGTDRVSEKFENLHSPEKTRDIYHCVDSSSISAVKSSEQLSEWSPKSNHVEHNFNAVNETSSFVDNQLLCSHDTATVAKDNNMIIHSLRSNHSDELICNEAVNFKQDISKEALLTTVASRLTGYFQAEEREQSALQPSNAVDENEIAMDRCNLPSSIGDEQFFTPLPSDVEADNEEKGDSETGKEEVSLQDSSSSFHTTVSSPTPDVQMVNKFILSLKSRKFKFTISPLSSLKSPKSTRYAASMPRENSSTSTTNSPRTPKASPNRCISPLSAALLESLLEDSLTTMLTLEHSQASGNETVTPHDNHNSLIADSAKSTDNSWQSNRSYDLNKIPVPEDLIPGLDLSGVSSTETDEIVKENDIPFKLEEFSSCIKVGNGQQIKSPEPKPLSEFRFYLSDEKWIIAEISLVSEKIWNLVASKQPLEILVNDDPNATVLNEVQMRQMIADRCCEIAKHCFKDVSRNRYMGLTNINCSRPRNLLHLKSIFQQELFKYHESNKYDAKRKKRWEVLSHGNNSDVENIVLDELYAEKNNWEDILENYENEIKTELVAELWNEQLDESLSAVINV